MILVRAIVAEIGNAGETKLDVAGANHDDVHGCGSVTFQPQAFGRLVGWDTPFARCMGDNG